jgi:hypothetical protein
MWEVVDRFKIRLGGNVYINIRTLVELDEEPLFTLKRHDETSYLGIYFEIYDSAGHHVASVKRNEIYYGDKDKYRIDGSIDRYVFSERESGRVLCDIKRYEAAHPAELDLSLRLYTPSGFLFEATPEQTNLPGWSIRGCTFEGGDTAISLTSIGMRERVRAENQTFTSTDVRLDSRSFENCVFDKCTMIYRGGPLPLLVGCSFRNCQWLFEGPALQTLKLLSTFHRAGGGFTAVFEELVKKIRGEQ